MKTTLDLPGDLVRQIKLRAMKEGKKLKDVAAELLRKGLAASDPSSRRNVSNVKTDSQTGLPYFRCDPDAPISKKDADEIYAFIHQSQEDNDIKRIGIPLRQSKNIKAADAVAFQRAVLEQLDAAGQSAYRGDVLLQFDFYSSANDPPAINRLPKNYLDLLGTPRDDFGIDRTRLLYRDDRQVKALIVRYHLLALQR